TANVLIFIWIEESTCTGRFAISEKTFVATAIRIGQRTLAIGAVARDAAILHDTIGAAVFALRNGFYDQIASFIHSLAAFPVAGARGFVGVGFGAVAFGVAVYPLSLIFTAIGIIAYADAMYF